MLWLALLSPAPIVACFVWLLDRKDQRHVEQTDRLMQRIQAPDVAVATQVQQDIGPMEEQYVPPDDDLAFQRNLVGAGAVGVEEKDLDWRDFLADRASADE